ncbi:MAG: hypothetical protein ACREL7_03575 [Longimicrobiales bacterium]
MGELRSPDGIERQHIHESGGSRLHTWPVSLAGLGIFLGAALVGWFGKESHWTDANAGVELSVDAPIRIRNGEIFEMLITVEADRSISDLVLLVDEDVWRDLTVNTFIPAANAEGYRDRAFAFRFGSLEAGSRFVIKIDGQVNPDHAPSSNRGRVAIADGDGEPLASVDYVMAVLP